MSDDSRRTASIPETPNSERTTRVVSPSQRPELIVPAASAAGFHAAMDFGADAVSLRLAVLGADDGFDLDALDLAVGHAHNNERRVYANLDSIIRERDWPEVIECLARCEEIGVDAVSLRDMGTMRAIREHFPRLNWHASERLRVHNPLGARWAERNGFKRVTLPPEITLDEVRAFRQRTGIALEVLIHGRLCPIRSELGALTDGDENGGSPAAAIDKLVKAGVKCLKIDLADESPVGVAAATDLYRRLIDRDGPEDLQRDVHLKFNEQQRASRLCFHPVHGRDTVCRDDEDTQPPGVYLGTVDEIRGERACFTAAVDFQRHDGLLARGRREGAPPSVEFDTDRINREGKRIFEVKKGERVSIVVPPDVKEGDELRLVSSSTIRRRYPTGVPGKVQRARLPVHLDVALTVKRGGERLTELGMPGLIEITGRVYTIEVTRRYPCKLLFADNQPMDETRLRRFFERLGSTRFELKTFNGIIPAGVFVPAAEVNEARRRFFEEMDKAVGEARGEARRAALEHVTRKPASPAKTASPTRFFALVDRPGYVSGLPLDRLSEVVLDIAHGTIEEVVGTWDEHSDKLRVAVPENLRKWNLPDARDKLRALFKKGARRFQVGSFEGFELVAEAAGIARKQRVDTAAIMKRSRDLNPRAGVAAFEPNLPDFQGSGIDLSTNWECHAVNREGVRCWLEQGVSRVTFNVADEPENLRELLREFAHVGELVVYQDTPQYIAETCVNADRLGHCPGKSECDFTETDVSVSNGRNHRVVDRWCRSVVLNDHAFSWSEHLKELESMGARGFRMDFIHRDYQPEEIRQISEQVMNARPVEQTHQGNWSRSSQ